MASTIAEKILSYHAGMDAKAGDIVLSDIDLLMGHDWNAALTVQVFREMGGDKVFDPGKVVTQNANAEAAIAAKCDHLAKHRARKSQPPQCLGQWLQPFLLSRLKYLDHHRSQLQWF